jgi:tetratricopeptide (TPR) repeat protein
LRGGGPGRADLGGRARGGAGLEQAGAVVRGRRWRDSRSRDRRLHFHYPVGALRQRRSRRRVQQPRQCHGRKRQYDRAIQDYDQAIRLKPDDADAFNSRCYARATINQLDAALADCNRSLALRPNDAATLDSGGFNYLKMGRLDAAIADYNAALRLDPKKAHALYGRGIAWRRKGDEARAAADIAAAKAIQADIAEELARRGLK